MEAKYTKALVKLSRKLAKVIDRTVQDYLETREDAAKAPTRDFGRLRLRIMRMVRVQEISPIVDQFGRDIVKSNTQEMQRLLLIDLAAETPATRALLKKIRKANVELIESIAESLLDDVFKVVTKGVARGTRVDVLARQIKERYAVSESRARLIARDQTLKANANLTAERHSQAGITHYVWSTSQDARVRPIHADLNGDTFAWSDPPITSEAGERNHPGGDYQCRCVAVPVLE